MNTMLKGAMYSTIIVVTFISGAFFSGDLRGFMPNIKEFRANPDYSIFYEVFNDAGVLAYVERFLILKSGSVLYNEELHSYIKKGNIRKDWFNELVIEKHYINLNEDIFIKELESYPFDSSVFTNHIIDNYFSENCTFFEKLNGVSRTLAETIKNLVGQETFFRCLIDQLKVGFDISISNTIYYIVDTNSVYSSKFLIELSAQPYTKFHSRLVAKYTNSRNKKDRATATKYLLDNIDKLNFYVIIDDLLKTDYSIKLITRLFNREIDAGYEEAIEFFHIVIHENITVAESIASGILKADDSTMRKGIIVLLNRHESVVGGDYLDQAFMGQAPRLEMFNQIREYIYGTNAAEQYIYISRHGYQETGKTFPPVYCKPPLDDEIELWLAFIEKYPWFPATDDAYYRLAFRYFVEKKYLEAKEIIKSFNDNNFADSDAEELINMLGTKINNVIDKREVVDYSIESIYKPDYCKYMFVLD